VYQTNIAEPNEIVFQSKADHPRTLRTDKLFTPVTLTLTLTWWLWHTVYELNLQCRYPEGVPAYLSTLSKVITWRRQRDWQTHTQTRPNVLPRRIRQWW